MINDWFMIIGDHTMLLCYYWYVTMLLSYYVAISESDSYYPLYLGDDRMSCWGPPELGIDHPGKLHGFAASLPIHPGNKQRTVKNGTWRFRTFIVHLTMIYHSSSTLKLEFSSCGWWSFLAYRVGLAKQPMWIGFPTSQAIMGWMFAQ